MPAFRSSHAKQTPVERNTLVVETANVDYPLLDDSGTPMSTAVRVVERYTLSEDDTRPVLSGEHFRHR